MDFLPIFITFAIITIAEIGDKTQLIAISFSAKYSRMPVFLGVVFGMTTVALIGVLFGSLIFVFIPIVYIKYASGIAFILFGIWVMVKKEEDENEGDLKNKSVFLSVFFLIFIAEFGDKTQLAVITLTAQYQNTISFGGCYVGGLFVLLGAFLGFALITAIGVLIGKKLSERVSEEKIKWFSSLLFIVIGILFLVEALGWLEV